MKDFAIVGLILIAALGWYNANQERNKVPEVTDHATILCPLPSSFSILRKTDGTVDVSCEKQPLEVPKVEVHAASTKPYILD